MVVDDFKNIYNNLLAELPRAKQRLEGKILKTPFLHSKFFSKKCNQEIYLKMESEQLTGSFKLRGSTNKIEYLTENKLSKNVVTASTGNHAKGVAHALANAPFQGTIWLPSNADVGKVEALRSYDVDLKFHNDSSLETELKAKEWAKEQGAEWVSPYNDIHVIAGQSTIAMEMLETINDLDAIVATVGGGGMISGIAVYVKKHHPHIKIIGAWPENSPEMFLSIKNGHIVDLQNSKTTLSDGSAGGLEPNTITFPICRELIDDYILISEEEISNTIKLMVEKHYKIIEGSAAVALAAACRYGQSLDVQKNKIGVVICGGNINRTTLAKIIQE